MLFGRRYHARQNKLVGRQFKKIQQIYKRRKIKYTDKKVENERQDMCMHEYAML